MHTSLTLNSPDAKHSTRTANDALSSFIVALCLYFRNYLRNYHQHLWLIAFLYLLAPVSIAANSVQISDQLNQIELGQHLEYFEDKKNNLKLSEVSDPQLNNLWVATEEPVPNMGFSNSTFWFRTKLVAAESLKNKYLLEVDYPSLDHLQVFLLRKNQASIQWFLGDRIDFKQRPIVHRNFIVPVPLDKGDTWIYLRTTSESPIHLPLKLWEEQYFHEQDQRHTIVQGGYFGIMLIIISYNILIFAYSRARSYLYYICYVFPLALFIASQQGFTFQYLWPGFSNLNQYAIPVTMNLTSIFGILFIIRFLKLRNYTPTLANRLIGMGAISAAFIPLAFVTNYLTAVLLATGIGIFISATSLYASYLSWNKGYHPARYIVFGIGSLVVGLSIFGLNRYGYIPHNILTENAAQIGSLVDIAFLSLALAERIHLVRQQKLHAQEKILKTTQEKIRLEERLLHNAVHDHNTGLPNRNMLAEVAPDILANATRTNTPLAIMLIYLNNFQDINNTLGHQNSSRLLAAAAARIGGTIELFTNAEILSNVEGSTHRVASIDSVSFVVILNLSNAPQAAQQVAEHINQTMHQPFELNGMAIEISLSIGISYFPEHGQEIYNLLRHTQVAVEVAHHSDKQYAIYDPSIDPYSARRLALMGELRQSINEDNLKLYFQPKVDIQKNQILGMEALLRWEHPEHGMLPPNEFIPLAEQTGIIKPLTRWVLDEALKQLKQLQQKGYQLSVAVNLSARNLQEQDLLEHLSQALSHYQLSPSCLVLEVTETTMMQDPEHALQTLKRISDMGIALSIDDFGTGYSSLAYLKQMPVQEIKIDRSFVTDMVNDKDDSVIVNTTLNMSHNLGLKVTAEGVEDRETLLKLRSLGCNAVQGYFLTQPIPTEKIEAWIENSEFDVVRNDNKVHKLKPNLRKN